MSKFVEEVLRVKTMREPSGDQEGRLSVSFVRTKVLRVESLRMRSPSRVHHSRNTSADPSAEYEGNPECTVPFVRVLQKVLFDVQRISLAFGRFGRERAWNHEPTPKAIQVPSGEKVGWKTPARP